MKDENKVCTKKEVLEQMENAYWEKKICVNTELSNIIKMREEVAKEEKEQEELNKLKK